MIDGHTLLVIWAPGGETRPYKARVEDLSRPLIREFLIEVGSDLATEAAPPPDLARQLQIARGTPEALFPLNVGLLCFHPEPHRFFPATQIDVVWFPDGPGDDQLTEKTFRGPLHHQLREALGYIERNYITEIGTKGL